MFRRASAIAGKCNSLRKVQNYEASETLHGKLAVNPFNTTFNT